METGRGRIGPTAWTLALRLALSGLVAALWADAVAFTARAAEKNAPTWWKGNLHTHSLWSDGDDYPEMIGAWYKEHGYHFLALSDHNVLSQGDRWIEIDDNRGGPEAFEKYREKFGEDWVETRRQNGVREVRLKPLAEFRHLFEEPNRFLLIQSEEITDRYEKAPVHLNGTNLRDFIPPQGGNSVQEVIQNNVNAVLQQREETGQPMFPHLNHPNFGWAITAEDLMPVQGERFFEVYNGHPSVRNQGDDSHAGTERIWDIILSWRLGELNMGPLYGLAVDDAHNYHSQSSNRSNPGRGWVVVRAPYLTPEHIVEAMEAGDFYASTGVRIRRIRSSADQIALEIDPEDGVSYTTRFIGTRLGFDRSHQPRRNAQGEPLDVTHQYSPEIGVVLAEIEGSQPRYSFKGDELYVRAKVISSKPKSNPYMEGEKETAWTQPVVPQP